MYRTIPHDQWKQALKEFTERNASRITVLEVNHPDVGAQQQESDYPLRGVAYDPRDHRIEIMFGDLAASSPHLTHTITSVTDVELLSDRLGEDEVLRIGHEGGQTLLKFRDVS